MTPTILLIEDDENDVFFMLHAFRKAAVGATLQLISDGVEAMAYLRGEGKYANRDKFPAPALTLLDLNIPYVHGLEVLRQIQGQPRKNIVIVLTSSGAESDIEAAYAFGANSYLLKPSTVDERLELVRDLEKYWLGRNKCPRI